MSYPSIQDMELQQKIANKLEFQFPYHTQTIEEICSPERFKLFNHQLFVRNFMAPHTPYNNLLLFMGIGTAKSCSAIQIAEEHKNQKRKIIVLLEKGVKNNFLNEIHNIDKGHNQCTGTTYQKYRNNHTREEKEKIKQKLIEQSYTIKTLGKFSNEIIKMTPTKIKQTYSNRLIIIDEVHNIREYDTEKPQRYDALKQMLSHAENCKLLLLSATPMFDNPREIVSLMNLFLINERQQVVNPDEVFNNKNELTKSGEAILKQKLNGQVFYASNEKNIAFPNMEVKGKLFPFMKNLKLTSCTMSSYQEEEYFKQMKETNQKNVLPLLRKNSNIIMPKSKDDLKDIGKISCKFEKLLKKISKTTGPIFIYSEFIEHTIKLLEKILLLNGYKQYINEKSTNSFIVLEGDVDSNKRTKLINIFNQSNNKNGEIIKIVIGSKVLKEGISLKNIRQVHILEPWYNMSRLEQVWGRAIRACSHVLLPSEKQKVTIYLYASIFKNLPNNLENELQKDFSEIKTKIPYDLYAYYLSEQKGIKIKMVENVLKQIAINGGKSRDAKGIDKTTYEKLYVLQPSIVLTKNIISDFLTKKGAISLKHLEKLPMIKKNNITEEIINIAVYELLQEKNGGIIRRNEFLIIQPLDKKDQQVLSMFDRMHTYTKQKYPLTLNVEVEPKKSLENRKQKTFQEQLTTLKDNKIIDNYQGILMSDGTFLIKQIVETTNKRKQTRGKNCMSWKSEELKEIGEKILSKEELKQFFVDKRIKHKEKFCKLLSKKFYLNKK